MVILVGCDIKNSFFYIFIIEINYTMNKEQLKRIFEHLEEKEGHNVPFLWKFKNNIPLTEKDLNIEGHLNLHRIEATSLPEGLKVKGNFYLKGAKIISLPKGLKVGGDLDLNGSNIITSLPEGLTVGGVLWLFGCESITSLPNDLKVGRGLDLRFTKVTSLPKGLEVDTFLVVSNTKLTKYSDEELREMVKPGFIKGKIIR